MIPAWLQRHLEATGAANPDGYGRTIRAGICNKCHAHVLRGLDADKAALPATVDPTPITRLGEVIAIAAGAGTYDLVGTLRRLELDRRDRWRIAGVRRHRVLAEHRCGHAWPAEEEPAPTPSKESHDVPF